MRSEAEIRDFFRSELLPVLRGYEQRRRELWKELRRPWALAAGLLAFGALLFGWLAPAMAIVALGCHRFYKLRRAISRDYKVDVVGRVVAFCDPGFEYTPAAWVPHERMQRSRLFPQGYTTMHCEDRVVGRMGATEFQLCEMVLRKRREKNRMETIFRGIFFVADFHKHFHGATVVLPDTAERTFGRFGRMVQRVVSTRGLELVELEDPDFERAFVTTSSDQVEARYILSPSMMKRILEFRQRTGSGFRLSFADSMLHAAIPLSRDLFEMAASRSLVDDAPIREMVRDLEWLSGIVEEMNLNTRIWTKR